MRNRCPCWRTGAWRSTCFPRRRPWRQGCGSAIISSGSGSSILGWKPDRIRIQGFNDQKLEKLQLKNFFLLKTAIYISLGLHKVHPSYRRSLQLSREAIQHFKTWTFKKFSTFVGLFCQSWIRIHWPDWIRIQFGSGFATLPGGGHRILVPAQPQLEPLEGIQHWWWWERKEPIFTYLFIF